MDADGARPRRRADVAGAPRLDFCRPRPQAKRKRIIKENDTVLVVGKIEHLFIEEKLLGKDGWIQLDKGDIVSINGLDGYAIPTLIKRFEYARPKK